VVLAAGTSSPLVGVLVAAEAGGGFDSFLIQATALLSAAALIGYLSARARVVPIVGFLLAGVVIGPNALGLVSDLDVVEIVAEVGIVLLLFTIGIEFSIERLVRIRRYVLVGGGTKVVLAIVAAVAVLLPFGVAPRDAVFTGFLVAISSTAIVLKVLAERGELQAPTGTVALALLIFEDLAAVLMVLLVPLLAGGGGIGDIVRVGVTTVVIVAAVLVGARRLLPRLLEVVARACSPEIFLLTVLAICIGTAWLTHLAGVSVSLGAFLAGLIVSESRQADHALGEVLPLQILFTAAFFLSIGMLLDVRFLLERPLLVVAAVAIGLFIPLLTGLAATSTLRVGAPTVLASSFLLAQVSEFSFVVERAGAAVGLSPAGLGEDGSQAFIAAVVLLMVVTPLSAEVGRRLAAHWVAGERRRVRVAATTGGDDRAPTPRDGSAPGAVLVSGWGPLGRHVAADLAAAGVTVRVVTLDPIGATEAAEAGHDVVIGDSVKRHVLLQAGIADVDVLIIGDDEAEDARRIAAIATELASELGVVVVTEAGAHELTALHEAGVHNVVDPGRATAAHLVEACRGHLVALGRRPRAGTAPEVTTVDTTRLIDVGVVASPDCPHTDGLGPVLASADGCEDCLRTGDTWVHLRLCLHCGHVGCCDSSPNRHARAHAHGTGHGLVASAEPDEAWAYCFLDDADLATTRPANPTRGVSRPAR
jgi:monovalent cation:H+ antiporter-2, CPA2 family